MKDFLSNERICCSSISRSLDMCILSLEHDFARLIFSFKKFQEIETKSLFLSFQNSFLAVYFPISPKSLDQNSSLISLLE